MVAVVVDVIHMQRVAHLEIDFRFAPALGEPLGRVVNDDLCVWQRVAQALHLLFVIHIPAEIQPLEPRHFAERLHVRLGDFGALDALIHQIDVREARTLGEHGDVRERSLAQLEKPQLLERSELRDGVRPRAGENEELQMRHLREKVGVAVQMHMAEIDGDHIVAVAQIVCKMVVLAVKILAVINGEIRLVGAHAVGIDLYHPDELHVLVPEIDRLHILIGNAAAQHHDLF